MPFLLIFFPIVVAQKAGPELVYGANTAIDIFGRMVGISNTWPITEKLSDSTFFRSNSMYVIIMPFIILGIILPFVSSFSLLNPKQKSAHGTRKIFLLQRILRFLILLGGALGFTAMMTFYWFMVKWSAFLELLWFKYLLFFYLAIFSFVSSMIVGLYSTFQGIELTLKIKDEIEIT